MISSRSRPCNDATILATPATGDCAAAAKPWVLLVAILGSSISYIDESVVNVALPAIETDLGTSVVVIQWLVNAYTLSLSAFLLVGGAAGDIFGRRCVFVIGVAIFAAASVWCGFSPTVSMIRQRVHAGLKRAVEQGKQLGRPKIAPEVEKRIQTQLRAGKGIHKVAREVGVGTGTVQRIKAEMAGPFVAEAA